jgi:S1-C subfamily serine protease
MNEEPLLALSRRTAEIVALAAPHVVRVEGRRRSPASGVAWSADLVITTHHALESDGEEVEVGLADGATATAEIAGRDATTDLALLRLKGGSLTPSGLADAGSDAAAAALAPGQLLLGISRPGRTPRAALGLVARAAGDWRGPGGGRIDRWLETSLDLTPGLSGGLALSADGTPVGLLTSGLVRGAAMVVPAETVRRVVSSLDRHGGIRRGYLGLATFPVRLPPSMATAAGQYGALLVSAVEPESPAAQAGLLLGDAVLALGGVEVSDYGDLVPLLDEEKIGKPLAVKLLRAGEPREIAVTVGVRERRVR